jgi:hypothetical protein
VPWPGVPDLPEGEGIGLGAGVGEGDLEGALDDGPVLPGELVQPLFGERAGAVLVQVGSVVRAGRLPVEEDPEPGGRSRRGRSHDQIEVARSEPAGDPPAAVSSLAASSVIVQSPARAQWLNAYADVGINILWAIHLSGPDENGPLDDVVMVARHTKMLRLVRLTEYPSTFLCRPRRYAAVALDRLSSASS